MPSAIRSTCSGVSGWNITVSSMRLRNSGRNASFAAERMRSSAAAGSAAVKPMPRRELPAPRFDVITSTVFVKSTVRPSPSVSRPSSMTCSSTFQTSGCAFSISSSSTTEYGRRRTGSVSWPPSPYPT